ncbi:hypothetical protein GIX45_08025 [Erwinia sp. CPCC 100877]|nr:hypothetical protein [Erwinia sp. CPCC 100877]
MGDLEMRSLAIIEKKQAKYLVGETNLKRVKLPNEARLKEFIIRYQAKKELKPTTNTSLAIMTLLDLLKVIAIKKTAVSEGVMKVDFMRDGELILADDSQITVNEKQAFAIEELPKQIDDNEMISIINAILSYQDRYGLALLSEVTEKQIPLRIFADYTGEKYVSVNGLEAYYQATIYAFSKYLAKRLNKKIIVGARQSDFYHEQIRLLFLEGSSPYLTCKLFLKDYQPDLYTELFKHRIIDCSEKYYVIDSLTKQNSYRVKLIDEEYGFETKYFYGNDLLSLLEDCNSYLFAFTAMNQTQKVRIQLCNIPVIQTPEQLIRANMTDYFIGKQLKLVGFNDRCIKIIEV